MAKAKRVELEKQLDPERIPRHIGIIMDGNGRWAKKRFRPHLFGHMEGAKAIRRVVEMCVDLKVDYLTFYAFSTENWNRSEEEVQGLLKLLKERLIKEIPELNKQNIYLQFIGSDERLDPVYWAEMQAILAPTQKNTGMVVNIAFNYGGRLEIIEGFKKLIAENDPEKIKNLNPNNFNEYLWTAGQPDPDLIIRTSGEMRLSNFLLWQSAYAEIYVTETYWPDFGYNDLVTAILDYQKRDRRFGGRK